MAVDPAIEATGLAKRYGETVAVDDLSLSVASGTIYGFLGPNGAGKSTTMRLLTGLTDPSEGAAYVAGIPVDDRRRLVGTLGYLPEQPPLYDEYTAREQLTYAASLHDLDGVEDHIDDYLDRFDLAGDADRRIEGYSKGMAQKTAFIQSVLHDPDVLFLDEPTSGLDPRAARTMREEITRLAESGTTVFLSTHVLPVVEQLADTVGVLLDGRLVAEDSTAALKTRAETGGDSTLEDAFLAVTGDATTDGASDVAPPGDDPGVTATRQDAVDEPAGSSDDR
jgi:ABC-2 type transport system ATP-binding protein